MYICEALYVLMIGDGPVCYTRCRWRLWSVTRPLKRDGLAGRATAPIKH